MTRPGGELHPQPDGQGRPRPPLFRALGRAEPPERIDVSGHSYQLTQLFKHDSWAATGLYQGPAGKIVCKFNRVSPMLFVPTKWLGNWLARREAFFLLRLDDLENVPSDAGPVSVGGIRQHHAVARHYVAGRPMRRYDHSISGEFLEELGTLFEAIHQRSMAYIDAQKMENVIIGEDGQPYVIDFQISFYLPERLRIWPLTWLLTLLQQTDTYHFHKHYSHSRPDLFGQTDVAVIANRPWWIRLHRYMSDPFRYCRRKLLVLLGIRAKSGLNITEHFPEDSVRRRLESGITG